MDGHEKERLGSPRFEKLVTKRTKTHFRVTRRKICVILALTLVLPSFARAENRAVFDLNAVVEAEPVATNLRENFDADVENGARNHALPMSSSEPGVELRNVLQPTRHWRIPLELSTLVVSATAPKIHQILLEVDLLDPQTTIADYEPRTQTSSSLAGPVAVEQCEEKTGRLGFNLRATYPPLATGDFGSEINQKAGETRKFTRVAPVEIVAACGTTRRRQGVFFKLRSTTTQVLEGDKAFTVTIQTPATWRRGLLRVRVRAEGLQRQLPGFPAEEVTLGEQVFLVAAYALGDPDSRARAIGLSTTIRNLERLASQHGSEIQKRATPTLFHHVAAKLELTEPKISPGWLQRVLLTSVDVSNDRQIRRLPVDVRVAILDFQQAREAFIKPIPKPVVSLASSPQRPRKPTFNSE